MWSIIVLFTSVFGVAVIDSLETNASYCAALDEYYETKTRNVIPLHGKLRSVYVNSQAQEVQVWGGRGAARAAAALLYVIIRYGLRYNTTLITRDPDFCNITARTWSQSMVVAPAAYWPLTGCGLGNRHIDRVARLNRPAVTSDLLFYMYLAPAYRRLCAHFQNWTSFTDSNAIKKCNFATPITIGNHNASCNECIAILASKEYKVEVVRNYKSQIKSLQLEITYYENDLNLRREMKSLKERNVSFLFIYDYLWSSVDGTYELRFNKGEEEKSTISILVGDGTLTYYYAPDIHKVITSNFTLDTNILRQILEKEESKLSLEEAACYWANESQSKFEILTKTDYNVKTYTIFFFVCDIELFKNTMRTPISKHINNNSSNIKFGFGFCSNVTNCNNFTELDNCLKAISRTQYIPGVVLSSWTDKISPVVDAAAINNIFITFASPVPNKNSLKTSCRSAVGNLFELAQAYHKFFATSNWYRIFIVSEATETALSFTDALKSSNKFIWKDVVTDGENIRDMLTEVKHLDVKVIVLNSEWRLSKEILCGAIELEMSFAEYVWITRNRDVLECNKQLVENFKHISIGLEWRGGMTPNNVSLFSRDEWVQSYEKIYNKSLTASNAEWDDFHLPSNVFNMAKATIRLSQAFTNFRSNHFDLIYNLHGNLHILNESIATYFDNTAIINESTIFIDEWWGNRRRSIAIWKVEDRNVSDVWLLNNDIFQKYLKISDRKKCIIKSGDPFAPRCHDLAVTLSVIIIILLIITLVIVRRLRLKGIAQKDFILLNDVINHRNHIASSLDAYLVERHLVILRHEIGSGCFGRVHFAELMRPGSNAVVVAAKEPHNGIGLEEEREFLHEASILALLNHKHIVRLIGICIKDGPPMLLMEHALYLDLRRYLIERRHCASKVTCPTLNCKSSEDISDESLTRFVMQAAAALGYLASRRLVHRDVRAANCLIDKERSLKLADFGMARRLNGSDCEYASHRRALFPVLYMAPESLDEGLFSPASDVWALGVLMLEVVTLGARPFGSWPATQVVRHVLLGGHAPLPPDATIHTRNLAVSCWRRNPEDRPSAENIVNYLSCNPQALSTALLSPNPMTEN